MVKCLREMQAGPSREILGSQPLATTREPKKEYEQPERLMMEGEKAELLVVATTIFLHKTEYRAS